MTLWNPQNFGSRLLYRQNRDKAGKKSEYPPKWKCPHWNPISVIPNPYFAQIGSLLFSTSADNNMMQKNVTTQKSSKSIAWLVIIAFCLKSQSCSLTLSGTAALRWGSNSNQHSKVPGAISWASNEPPNIPDRLWKKRRQVSFQKRLLQTFLIGIVRAYLISSLMGSPSPLLLFSSLRFSQWCWALDEKKKKRIQHVLHFYHLSIK